VNTSVTFTATTTNQPNDPVWSVGSSGSTNVGTPTFLIGTTFSYTAPPTPPIYSRLLAFTQVQGTVNCGSVGLLDDAWDELENNS
jgi:hypothetical protein